jgi:ELWxxDGT repeat protein
MFFRRSRRSGPRPRKAAGGRFARPQVEPLEERALLSATLVKDINPHVLPAVTGGALVIGNTAYLSADDGVHGAELWKSDGTAAGTVLVKDINPGGEGSSPRDLFAFNGRLFFTAFTASDGPSGPKLWRSDGTAAGTVRVADLQGPANFTVVNGQFFFTAYDRAANFGLWKSDGTSAGTVLVKTFTSYNQPGPLTAAYGRLYFTTKESSTSTALWKSERQRHRVLQRQRRQPRLRAMEERRHRRRHRPRGQPRPGRVSLRRRFVPGQPDERQRHALLHGRWGTVEE